VVMEYVADALLDRLS
jgi:hypothetical protein